MSTMDADLKEFLDSTNNDMMVNLFILDWMSKRIEKSYEDQGIKTTVQSIKYDCSEKTIHLDVNMFPPRTIENITINFTV